MSALLTTGQPVCQPAPAREAAANRFGLRAQAGRLDAAGI
jgi:hypothetical protein